MSHEPTPSSKSPAFLIKQVMRKSIEGDESGSRTAEGMDLAFLRKRSESLHAEMHKVQTEIEEKAKNLEQENDGRRVSKAARFKWLKGVYDKLLEQRSTKASKRNQDLEDRIAALEQQLASESLKDAALDRRDGTQQLVHFPSRASPVPLPGHMPSPSRGSSGGFIAPTPGASQGGFIAPHPASPGGFVVPSRGASPSAFPVPSPSTSQELQELKDRLTQGIQTVPPRAVECTPGTRTRILGEIATKTHDCDGRNIILIRGAPGSGKSSICLTAKSLLRHQGRLITYFRFDHKEAASTTLTALWRHVAYGLARLLPAIRTMLLQLLRDDTVDLNSPMDVFISLVEGPLSNIKEHTGLPLVIAIDGLDECGSLPDASSDRQSLLQSLRRWPHLPPHFKLLVTSREEGDIDRVLSPISTSINVPSGRFLSNDPDAETSIDACNDIRTFLEDRFRCIRERFPSLPADWPGTRTVTDMIHRAAGNFMWATSVASFIDRRGTNPQKQLDIIMDHEPAGSMNSLYSLYTAILDSAFGHIAVDDPAVQTLRYILGTMVLARRPLDDIEYTKLPTAQPVTKLSLDFIREGLRSVIAPGPDLCFVHRSFDDFLLSEECPSKYRIMKIEAQRLLTEFCLMTLETELHFNICGLETSYLKNSDVYDITAKITNGISTLLSYCCRFFAHHLIGTPFDEGLLEKVKAIVFDKLLYWFEAMSLLEGIEQVSHSLLMILQWSHPSPDDEFKDFVRDAHRFVGAFGQPIAQSAPHIYLSALPFAPEYSFVARRFLPRFPSIPTLTAGRPSDWPSCIFTSEYHKSGVNSVAFSPDEKYFVSGSEDGTICICDSETGNLVSGPLDGDSPVLHVFFDPDGRRVWSTSSKGGVVGWDANTGHQLHVFQTGPAIACRRISDSQTMLSLSSRQGAVTLTSWNTDTGERLNDSPIDNIPTLASFSPDGHYMACAGYSDTHVRVSKLVEGSGMQILSPSQPQFGHPERISTLSFSADGDFVVSGSKDGTILIWDGRTGEAIGPPLLTGTAKVNAVAYSHKNRFLVSASESSTAMVWNALTHEVVHGPLDSHASRINNIVLSRDGRRALSASQDKTVRMWDLGRKGAVSATQVNEVQGHATAVRCATFSPCGKKLASLDDKTIRVWDANTGEPLPSPINSLVYPAQITYSPDGTRLVAHNSLGTLNIWNADTGELAFCQELGGESRGNVLIEHFSFRSTDHRVVMCSERGVVRIWNLEGGMMVEDLSTSSPQSVVPDRPIKIVALSPDGGTAIVRDYYGSPQHYMWNTSSGQPLPVTFADDEYVSGSPVAYSSTGQFFAASHFDDGVSTLRVWSAVTGELTSGPLRINGRVDCLAFSHNSSHIACAYPDIWIWDIRTSHLVSGPWTGHADTIGSLSFSPDGEKLVSGSMDGQIRIWNTADILGDSYVASGFLGTGRRIQNGWVRDKNGGLLFWVPKDHRSRLFWPGNVAVIGGRGIPTKLDLARFRYGENWEFAAGSLEYASDWLKDQAETQQQITDDILEREGTPQDSVIEAMFANNKGTLEALQKDLDEAIQRETLEREANIALRKELEDEREARNALGREVETLQEQVRIREERIWELEQVVSNLPKAVPTVPEEKSAPKSFIAKISRGLAATYSKFVVEVRFEDPETGVERSLRFNVNSDVLLIAFHSAGADKRPSEYRLTGNCVDETDLAGTQVFAGQIGRGKLFLRIAPDVVIKGEVVGGPPNGLSFSGDGTWTGS